MKNNAIQRVLTIYYGVLQSAHLLTLLRASFIILQTGEIPFPALSPPGGWLPQAIPFLVGMGVVDAVAIVLALIFVFQTNIRKNYQPIIGIISMTIAMASAVQFAVGTIPSGAWSAHPLAYGLMVVLFAPVISLYFLLLQSN